MLALVLQLLFVARRAGHAGKFPGFLALPVRGRDHCLADADRQAVRVVLRICGFGDQTVALAVRVRPDEFLAVGELQVQEDVVRDDCRALREVVIPLPIRLRPRLIEVYDGTARGLGRTWRREEQAYRGGKKDRQRKPGNRRFRADISTHRIHSLLLSLRSPESTAASFRPPRVQSRSKSRSP